LQHHQFTVVNRVLSKHRTQAELLERPAVSSQSCMGVARGTATVS